MRFDVGNTRCTPSSLSLSVSGLSFVMKVLCVLRIVECDNASRVKMIGWFRILEDLSVDVLIRLLRSCKVPRVRYVLFLSTSDS